LAWLRYDPNRFHSTDEDDLGLVVFAASAALHCARINLLAGDLPRAEDELRGAYDALARIDEKYLLVSIAELLARVVCAQGRPCEAEGIGRAAEGPPPNHDVGRPAVSPLECGPVRGWQERADETEWRAREALDLVRIEAALARLSTWYPRSGSGERGRSPSDQRACDAPGPAAPELTRERFLRHILADKQLPDRYARQLALETLDIPEERFREGKPLPDPLDAASDRAGYFARAIPNVRPSHAYVSSSAWRPRAWPA
jgi:hypothetical protein